VTRYLIGLTGNIATGKSTVAALLAELGATVIDADKIAHQVMRRGGPVYGQIVAAFGPTVVGADGEINREHLGRIVFSDPTALRRLEALVHPAVGVEVGRFIEQAKTPVVVIEAIKLLEAGLHHLCRAVWVTTCPAEQRIDRLMKERLLSFKEAQRRVAAQPPQTHKDGVADVLIDTSGDIAATRRQVEAAWQAIDVRRAHGDIRDVRGVSR
jgi:dephospho-CoA kinase